jgi:uncharacterized protein YbbC (DUF1343 family)
MPFRRFSAPLVVSVMLALAGCSTIQPPAVTPQPPPAPAAARVGFAPEKLSAIDAAITAAIAAKKTPGGVLWVEHDGDVYRKAYGARAVVPAIEAATEDTIYDAASVTKVMATTTAIMQLVERGKLDLHAPVVRYVPAFAQNGKGEVTLWHLLTHTSGLRPDLDYRPAWSGADAALEKACAEKLHSVPGSTFVYSDINFIVLGEIARLVSGRRLDRYCAEEVFGPLGMHDTRFLPPASVAPRIAPTEMTEGKMLRGVVHDPSARMMGGVAGHAGLFTTAADLARFCRMLLNGGELDGVRILSAATVAEMTRVQNDSNDRRGLGWDVDSRYSGPRGRWFPAGASFGHTGFTGPSLWLDPASRTFVVFLCNRVHPDGKGDVVPLRRTIGTLAAEAIGLDRGAVLNGIDVLVRDEFAPLRGLRIGLITNQSGRDRENRSTIDLLHAAKDVKLVALFSPEHGIRGTADTSVGDTKDEKTGLPVYSLYGEPQPRVAGETAAQRDLATIRARAPKPEQLRDLDALVFDVQDIGARFYTYPATLGAALEAAGRAHKKFFVLDRVNPITDAQVEGPVMTRPPTFTGYHAVPIRYGMTTGELAMMLNAELGFGADLVVIRCENWSGRTWLDRTGLPWTNPSPAIRSLTAAALYPGVCLVEGTSVSVGRGTLQPFEQIGAPWIDAGRLAAELNAAGLVGVHFEPVHFTPRAALYAGTPASLKLRDQDCGGVRIVLTDRDRCAVVDMGVTVALTLQRLWPDHFKVDAMARLLGDDETLQAIAAGKSLAAIKALWAPRLAEFAVRREKFLLYRDAAPAAVGVGE